ncbi:MAG: hydrogenase 3 maturation endopeptidase HyCI [Candidatus Bathyarchaeota archaeon]|jgi:hydrogenase 3 maturation protease
MNESGTPISDGIVDELRLWFSGSQRIVIVGIGNPLRRDDYAGVMIVRKLKSYSLPQVHLFECETVPESFMQQIIELRPSHILIIDAAILNIQPGDYRLVRPDELLETQAVSTHMLPLRIFCQYLTHETKAEMLLLLIQPRDVSFGEGITTKLEKTVTHTVKLLQRILQDNSSTSSSL